MLKMVAATRTASAVAVALFIAACSTQRSELARVVSPDQTVVATLVREDAGGAAGSRVFYVYLARIGSTPSRDGPTFTAVRCEGISLTWHGNRRLDLRYQPLCDVRQFRNHWYADSVARDDQLLQPSVEVVLVRDTEAGP